MRLPRRKIVNRCRRLLLRGVLLAGLLPKLLIPAGFMPAALADGGPIIICGSYAWPNAPAHAPHAGAAGHTDLTAPAATHADANLHAHANLSADASLHAHANTGADASLRAHANMSADAGLHAHASMPEYAATPADAGTHASPFADSSEYEHEQHEQWERCTFAGASSSPLPAAEWRLDLLPTDAEGIGLSIAFLISRSEFNSYRSRAPPISHS